MAVTADAPTTSTFLVPEGNLEALRERLVRINRRARKLGVPESTLTETGHEEMKTVSWTSLTGREPKRKIRYVEIAVDGKTPRFPGWVLLAAIDHTEALPLIDTVPGRDCPTDQRDRGPICDHCGFVRNRHKTLVLEHEDGKVVQVGSTCIGDFLGSMSFDPQRAAAFAEALWGFLRECGDAEQEGWGGGGWSPEHVEVVEVATLTAAVLKDHPWVPKSRSDEYDAPATAELVSEILFPPDLRHSSGRARAEYEAFRVQVSSRLHDVDDNEIVAAVEWAKSHVKSHSDYLYNLAAAVLSETVKAKRIGLVVSLLPSYRREMGRLETAARKQARWATSQHVGTEGKRETFTLTYVSCRVIEGDYGVSYLLTFEEGQGNQVKWFSSRPPDGEHGLGMEAEKTYRVKATVKRHGAYQGVLETVVNRGVVIET